jgi:hypothetical protein
MKSYEKYTTSKKEKTIFFVIITLLMIMVVIVLAVNYCKGEDALVKCWILCKPGSQVNVRRTPSKTGQEVGFLEVGDDFLTDGTSADGWIRCYGIGEYGEGWIYSGYVATEEPVPVFEQYVCCGKGRVACRRWMNGPKIDRTPWLANGSNVDVFYIAGDWALTSRGYIMSKYLEADPR